MTRVSTPFGFHWTAEEVARCMWHESVRLLA
jgi:hypothetical protein